MYETFVMLKSEGTFSLEELERAAREVADSWGAEVSRSRQILRMTAGEAFLEIRENSDYYVPEECHEIADQLSLPCREFRRAMRLREKTRTWNGSTIPFSWPNDCRRRGSS